MMTIPPLWIVLLLWCYAGLHAMKRSLFVPFVLFCAMLYAAPVRILWDYSPEELPGMTFRVYQSRDVALPIEQWQHIAQLEGQTNIIFDIQPGHQFFKVSASNWTGIAFSPPLETNGPPSAFQIQIRKEP